MGVKQSDPINNRRLRSKVPALMLMMHDQRNFWTVFGLGLCVFALYGPVVGSVDHNGWRYLGGPFVCAALATVYYLIVPYRPYSGSPARVSGLIDLDARDEDARRLTELYRSDRAKSYLLKASGTLLATVLTIMVMATIIFWSTVDWSVPSKSQLIDFIVGTIGFLVALGAHYISWGLRTWLAHGDA